MRKRKKNRFSIVKAVKSNARDRVGPVPPERVIADGKPTLPRKAKHKKTMSDLLSTTDESA